MKERIVYKTSMIWSETLIVMIIEGYLYHYSIFGHITVNKLNTKGIFKNFLADAMHVVNLPF